MSVKSRVELIASAPELPRVRILERALLFAVIGFYFVGDILTTVISMELGGYESTESIRVLINSYGYIGLIGHKALILGIVAIGWIALSYIARQIDVSPRPFRAAYLSIFAFRGISVVVWNTYFIYLLLTNDSFQASAPVWL